MAKKGDFIEWFATYFIYSTEPIKFLRADRGNPVWVSPYLLTSAKDLKEIKPLSKHKHQAIKNIFKK
jgi:hypothetical protein